MGHLAVAGVRFIVVADSHIRLPDDDVATYPSNALMADRNRRVVELCNLLRPEFVVHLGDVVHPVPAESAHEAALGLAADIYSDLDAPIHFVPGNHDIGDKPNAMVAVPSVAEDFYPMFERYWGSAFASFDVGACHFVILDTPVLNSGLEREVTQRTWLEDDLAAATAAKRRILIFTHYPPFVRESSEDEHYDNLGEPARSWLLDQVSRHRVEAVFSGHVHNFFFNHYAGTDLYVVPSTGFVRPDYSELASIAPESEGGRDDPAKLGIFLVEVGAEGHQVRPIRTFGRTEPLVALPQPAADVATDGWQCPIGVTLRHGWKTHAELPTFGLDEFRRKTIRNDALLLALWEARITRVRIPSEDLAGPDGLDRIRHLKQRGMRFTVRSAGIPGPTMLDRIQAASDVADRWELVVWPAQFEPALTAVGEVSLRTPIALAPVVPIGLHDGEVHHFVTSGFEPAGDPMLDGLMRLDTGGLIDEIVFRASPESSVTQAVALAEGRAERMQRKALVNVELPRAGENRIFDDDDAIGDRVVEAVTAARACPEVAVFLDGFMDHDRSYYPRHGLVDRHFNPRSALYRMIEAASR